MKTAKKQRLEAAGFKVGSAQDFLQLSPEESAFVSMRLNLAKAVRTRRQAKHFSQVELAKRLQSSQSRIAKLEAGENSVSLDLMVRAMLATGAAPRDVGRALAVG